MSGSNFGNSFKPSGTIQQSQLMRPPSRSPQFPDPESLEVSGTNDRLIVLTGVALGQHNPFDLTLREFLGLSLEETRKLHEQAAILSEHVLDDAWKRGIKQVIICDGKIVYETSTNASLSEIVKREAKQRNKPCYAFSAPPLIEEFVSVWTHVEGNDYYPTLLVNLSPPDCDDIQGHYVSINADFDTGNQRTKAFDITQIGELLGEISPLERVLAMHPAGRYAYFPKRAKLWVKDEAGLIHSAIVDDIQLIEQWERSALVAYSRNRAGFTSRDLLRILNIRVELDPVLRVTRIYEASSQPS